MCSYTVDATLLVAGVRGIRVSQGSESWLAEVSKVSR